MSIGQAEHCMISSHVPGEKASWGGNIDWNKGQNIIFRDISPKAYRRFISDGIKPQKCLISPIIQKLSHAAAVTASSHFTQISFHFTFLLHMWKFLLTNHRDWQKKQDNMIQAKKKEEKKNQQETQTGHFILPKTDFSIPMFWLANLRPQQWRAGIRGRIWLQRSKTAVWIHNLCLFDACFWMCSKMWEQHPLREVKMVFKLHLADNLKGINILMVSENLRTKKLTLFDIL